MPNQSAPDPCQFFFDQTWLAPGERAFSPGTVQLGRRDDRLVVSADLQDQSIGTDLFPFNFPAFQHTDVFEIFLHAAGARFYYEFHITPSNSVMQLQIPLDRPPGSPFQDYLVEDRLFISEPQIQANSWQVIAEIPLLPLCGSPRVPEQWSVSFGRYDYTAGNPVPVISSTSSHTVCNFHRREEWSQIELAAVPVLKF